MLELERLRTPLPRAGEATVLSNNFSPDEFNELRSDINRDDAYIAFDQLRDVVTIDYAKSVFSQLPLNGIVTAIDRLRAYVPDNFSWLSVSMISRPIDLPYKTEGKTKDMYFEVVTSNISYRLGGNIHDYKQYNGVLVPATSGDTLCANNQTRAGKRPIISAANGIGRRLCLRYMR